MTDPPVGGSSEVQVVGAGNVTSCLNTISANATTQTFNFSPAGRARQCLKGFDVSWNNVNPADQPYNMSVVPLDQGFYPYEVELANGGFDGDWQVNMTTGTRFTLMLKYVTPLPDTYLCVCTLPISIILER